MKTAEEWLEQNWRHKIHSDEAAIELCKQIQLDAMKEGARRAAEMARNHLHGTASGWVNLTKRGETVNNVILTAAEQWTGKDL